MRAAAMALVLAACGPAAEVKPAVELAGVGAPVSAGDITIENATVRPPPGGVTTGAGYMTIRNAGATPDRLLGARSPQARVIELHTHREVEGVMRMERVESVEVPAGGKVRFATGGLHLMVFGFAPAGEATPIILRFEKAGEVTVTFTSAPVGARH